MSRFVVVFVCALAILPGCADSSAPQPTASFAATNFDRIELHAWRETLGSLYPITIARSDSIAKVVELFAPNSASWREAAEFPGIPILAAFYEGQQLRTEFGFVETAHGQGGYLVNRNGTQIRVRTATDADITQFLSFFGMGVVVIKN
jgi:hypothetical protein